MASATRAATWWAGLFPDSDVSAPFVVYIQANTSPSLCFPCWLTDQIKPDRTPKAASFQSGILVRIIHSCLCYCFFFYFIFFCRPLWIQEAERQIGCFFSISFLGPCTFARPIEGRARSLVPTFPLLSFALHALSFCLFLLKFLYFEKDIFHFQKIFFEFTFTLQTPQNVFALKLRYEQFKCTHFHIHTYSTFFFIFYWLFLLIYHNIQADVTK